jgi:DHA2 family multidrug resistance protein-like MFS transporter
VEYASWHWIFLINLPVGIVGAIATLMLMPNYTMQTRRFDFLALSCWPPVWHADPGARRAKRAGDFIPDAGHSGRPRRDVRAVVFVACRGNDQALFSLSLFKNTTYRLGLFGSFAGRVGSGMLPFMTPVFLQIGMGFSPFHAGLMMIPMVLGSMGMKRIVVQVVNRFGYRRVLVSRHAGAGAHQPAVYGRGADGLVLRTAAGSVLPGHYQLHALLVDEYPDAERSAGRAGQQRQQPAVDDHAAFHERGVTVAGLLLGMYGQHHLSVDTPVAHQVFLYTYLSMAVIIALPAFIFARVPDDTSKNVVIRRGKRSAS